MDQKSVGAMWQRGGGFRETGRKFRISEKANLDFWPVSKTERQEEHA